MIDTVKLMLINPKIRNKDLFKFKTDRRDRYVYGYMKNFEDDGIYRPRLFLLKNFYDFLFVTFSVPKLIFGNNLKELKGTEFKGIVHRLRMALDELGVTVTEEDIENALVRRVDYSKNFILNQRNINCEDVINIVETSSYPRLKFHEVIKGKYIKFCSKSLSIIFYDKLEEMKAHGATAPHLSEIMLMAENRILRIEVQIKGKYGTEQRLAEMLGAKKHLFTFKEIFNENIMKKVFNYNLKILDDRLPNIILKGQEIEELNSLNRNKNIIGKKILFLTLQNNYNGYNAGKEKAIELYGENFVKKNNCVLVNNENLQCILIKFLEELKDYKPLFNL